MCTPPGHPTRLVIASATALLLVVATACGTTAPHTSTTVAPAAGGAASPGGALSVPSGSTGTTTGRTTTGGTTTGGGTTGSGTTTGGTTTGGTQSGGGGSLPTGHGGGGHLSARPSVPGVTATTIYIGSYYNKNQGAGNAALGVGGTNQGDARKPQNVMINWVNSHGGVAGRKLVPIYYGFDASGTGPPTDQQDQAACAKWTQDNKVFAILAGGSPVVDECAKKEGAVDFGQSGTPSIYRKYPYRIDPDSLNMVRAQKVTVDGLAMHGYFNSGAKIGVVSWDGPDYHEAIDNGLIPALKAHGVSLATPPYYVAEAQTLQDLGSSSAAVNDAVLKFSTLGIDHVLLADGPAGVCIGACLTIEFLKRAESQQYYPRYGFNDSNQPIELQKLNVLSSRQAQGSVFVNWSDLGPDYEVGYHPNPRLQFCTKLMSQHGVDMSNTNSKAAALLACADMWFLQATGAKMDSLGLSLSADSFIHAVEALGYSYLSPLSYANYFSPTQHDGVAGVRHAVWDNSASKYKWIGTIYKVG